MSYKKLRWRVIRIFLAMIWGGALCAADFSVCSYNCGCLPERYDYVRAVCMHKLVQERYQAEPERMAEWEKIQECAARALFGGERWVYQTEFEEIIGDLSWEAKSESMVTPYQVRPVEIFDPEVDELMGDVEAVARRIFAHELKYDILCLQEADYVEPEMLEGFAFCVSKTPRSKNVVAWKPEKFALVEVVGEVTSRGLVVRLKEMGTGEDVIVASGHLSGCNPFQVVGDDSARGDEELEKLLALMEGPASVKVLGMDANVTAAHPRMQLLKSAGYRIDCERFLEPTCTNPHQVLGTRIDWIAVKGDGEVINVPVLGVGLNSPETNMSDHKPVAAVVKKGSLGQT